ncbi:Zip-domain-containing protein [Parathielavia hyrcaniae]|uniref:Zip-domain-containing protein n=1 Tax=Parathielavia hyrcaniae TaxID=113614 RepID=A0AAN6PX68_9PEZI|nr:Zip-domain-containing protein [Parathielavia hyrcaniae]
MVRLSLRASALYSLLAVSCGQAISPAPRTLRQRAPHVVTAVAEPDPTATQTADDSSTITAVSECHLHGSALYCMAGTAKYEVHTTVTATQDIPAAFTGCHSHGAETFCLAPDGEHVEIQAAAAEEEEEQADESSTAGLSCHFHAGVEHCTSGSESQVSCARVERDYNVRLRIGLLFVMLVTSAIGVFTPILVASFISPKHAVFTVLRQFGTGVIISTAFVHLLTHANLMFQNECLGELAYEATAAAILMAGLFLSFCIEYTGNRFIQWHQDKARSDSIEVAGQAPASKNDMVNIGVLEAGVIFHSLIIGLTLVVAGDAFFLTLFAVIVFHQMFEGLALGTRIAALGRPLGPTSTLPLAAATTTTAIITTEAKPNLASVTDASNNNSTHTLTPSTITISATSPNSTNNNDGDVTMRQKLLLASAFAVVTPLGMAIGIGVLHNFNGNDPATVVAIGTLDALSAGILVWVGVVEMWAHDWMLQGGEMTRAGAGRTAGGMAALVVGMAGMSLLGKWA